MEGREVMGDLHAAQLSCLLPAVHGCLAGREIFAAFRALLQHGPPPVQNKQTASAGQPRSRCIKPDSSAERKKGQAVVEAQDTS
jgi:hypothetical protein